MKKKQTNALDRIVSDRGSAFTKDNIISYIYNPYMIVGVDCGEYDLSGLSRNLCNEETVVKCMRNMIKDAVVTISLPSYKELRAIIKERGITRSNMKGNGMYIFCVDEKHKKAVNIFNLLTIYEALDISNKPVTIRTSTSPIQPIYFDTADGEAALMPCRFHYNAQNS